VFGYFHHKVQKLRIYIYARDDALLSLFTAAEKDALAHTLSLLVPLVAQTSPIVANRLEAAQRANGLLHHDRLEGDIDNTIDGVGAGHLSLDSMVGLSSVDGHAVHSRAGPYIFLHSLVESFLFSFRGINLGEGGTVPRLIIRESFS
jgi:hypothetical protein